MHVTCGQQVVWPKLESGQAEMMADTITGPGSSTGRDDDHANSLAPARSILNPTNPAIRLPLGIAGEPAPSRQTDSPPKLTGEMPPRVQVASACCS